MNQEDYVSGLSNSSIPSVMWEIIRRSIFMVVAVFIAILYENIVDQSGNPHFFHTHECGGKD